MIEIEHLSKRYGSYVAVDDVSLRLARGSLTALIGPNGAGKSTLLAMLARLTPPDAGRVLLDGLDVQRTPDAVLARRLAILRQDNAMSMRLTVRELVGFGRYPHCRGRPGPQDEAQVERALRELDLLGLAERYLDQLSGGQRQRAHVAMTLAQDTDHLLLDEPLNNLDLRHAQEMMRLTRRLVDEFGKTVVVVLHDINFAACWADHVVAMREGRVVQDGSPQQVMQPEVLRDVYGLAMEVVAHRGFPLGLYWR
jgi:iron complex transport system ATP-binding protein